MLVFARSELLGLPHANVAQRTIETRTVPKILVSSLSFDDLLVGLDVVGNYSRRNTAIYLPHVETISALATVGVTANLTPELG